MSFDDIERIIGEKLPRSATRHRAWWSNNATNNVMTQAWLEAGFHSEEVHMERRKLVFRRIQPRRRSTPGGTTARESANHPLFGWMKGTLTVAPDVDLTAPADPNWDARASERSDLKRP